jgi:hypothetical protein
MAFMPAARCLAVIVRSVAVMIVVHEHMRLGRGIELAALAGQVRAAGIAG